MSVAIQESLPKPKPANVQTFSKPLVAYASYQTPAVQGDEVAYGERVMPVTQQGFARSAAEAAKRPEAMKKFEGVQEDPYIYRNMPQGLQVQAPVKLVRGAPPPPSKEEQQYLSKLDTERQFDKQASVKEYDKNKAAIAALRSQMDRAGLLEEEKKKQEAYKAWLEQQRVKHGLPYGASQEDIEFASGTTAL